MVSLRRDLSSKGEILKPIDGKMAFKTEALIHKDALLKKEVSFKKRFPFYTRMPS